MLMNIFNKRRHPKSLIVNRVGKQSYLIMKKIILFLYFLLTIIPTFGQINIGGNIGYWCNNQPINNVTVTLSGDNDTLYTTTTDINGYYQFNVPSGITYIITPSRKDNCQETLSCGLENEDQVQIQKHILTVETLNPFQIIAADADNNGTVNVLDNLAIQDVMINGGSDDFDGNWDFIATPYVFNDPLNPFNELEQAGRIKVLQGSSDALNMNFNAIKTGDVNCTYDNQCDCIESDCSNPIAWPHVIQNGTNSSTSASTYIALGDSDYFSFMTENGNQYTVKVSISSVALDGAYTLRITLDETGNCITIETEPIEEGALVDTIVELFLGNDCSTSLGIDDDGGTSVYSRLKYCESCIAPTNLRVENNTLLWDEVPSATHYQVKLLPNNTSPLCLCIPGSTSLPISITINDPLFENEVSIPEEYVNSCFKWQVKAKCGDSYSSYSDTTCYSGNEGGNGEGFTANVYPNPNNGDMTFTIQNTINSTIAIKVYNFYGVLLTSFNKSVIANVPKTVEFYAAGDLPNGMYFVNFETGEQTIQKTVIVN